MPGLGLFLPLAVQLWPFLRQLMLLQLFAWLLPHWMAWQVGRSGWLERWDRSGGATLMPMLVGRDNRHLRSHPLPLRDGRHVTPHMLGPLPRCLPCLGCPLSCPLTQGLMRLRRKRLNGLESGTSRLRAN